MGKQIQLNTTIEDAQLIQSFFEKKYRCIFYKSFAKTKEDLVTNNLYSDSKILIWNKDFNWIPEYKQTANEKKMFYISNTLGAPLLEFINTDWNKKENGRIYWEKFFTTDKIKYDLKKFELFYNDIVKWIKKTAPFKEKYNGINIYYFKNAWEKKSEE